MDVYTGWKTVEKESEPPIITREDFRKLRYRLHRWEPSIFPEE